MDETPKKKGRPRKQPGDPKSPYTMSEKALAVRRQALPSVYDPSATEPGTNAHYIKHAMGNMFLPKINFRDPEQVEKRIVEYFGRCAEQDMRPTVSGLSHALGVDRRTVQRWRSGQFRETTHAPVIEQAYNALEELWESYMLNNKMNVVGGIFLGKNNFGYTDQQDIVVTPRATIEPADAETIAAKYAELPEDYD